LRRVAELASGLVDREPIVRAEELDVQTGEEGFLLRAGEDREMLCGAGSCVERTVGQVDGRRAGADVARYRVKELLLGGRAVVADVVGLANRVVVVEGQQQSLHDVCDVDER
jgi:hypothetical protein